MGGAKLTISPRGGGIWQGKVPWVKSFSMKNPPDITSKNWASLDWFTLILIILVVCLADEVCCARLLTRMTCEMNLAITRQEEWGNSLVANSRSGNVIPPATLSSVGTRTVVFTLTSDIQTTHQSNARARKIYYLLGNLSCLFFFDLLWEMTSSNEEWGGWPTKRKGK